MPNISDNISSAQMDRTFLTSSLNIKRPFKTIALSKQELSSKINL